MGGDLHIYTTYSIGTQSVGEALLLAKERGHAYAAVVDRNTIAGVAEAQRLGARLGMTVVTGVEIEAIERATRQKVLILGYGFSFPASSILEMCERAAESRPGGPPDTSEAIRAINADGGVAVLAYTERARVASLVDRLAAVGLDGVEAPVQPHGTDERSIIREAARRTGLFVTGGQCDRDAIHCLVRRGDEQVRWADGLVREAGRMARAAILSEPDADLKGGDIRDLVTAHDKEIDRFLIDAIRARYPRHAFVTEEHEHPPADPDADIWIIDPIDGTTNFVASRDYFAVSVAHYRGRTPVFGIVYDVMRDELYLGMAGKGAYINGQPLAIPDLMRGTRTPETSVIECSLVCSHRLAQRYGASVERLATGFRAQRAFGCASLGICRIARGTLDVYLSCSLALWDYAAAAIVLSEAGGVTAVEAGDSAPGVHTDPDVGTGLIYHDDRRVVLAAADHGAVRSVREAVLGEAGPELRELSLGPDL
jgi:myo-inositol-1(or 4)-monophosphatase